MIIVYKDKQVYSIRDIFEHHDIFKYLVQYHQLIIDDDFNAEIDKHVSIRAGYFRGKFVIYVDKKCRLRDVIHF